MFKNTFSLVLVWCVLRHLFYSVVCQLYEKSIAKIPFKICTNEGGVYYLCNSKQEILLHARHFAVALEKARLRENALNISFQLLSVAPTSESSILIMVASIPVYSPATSLVGNYIDNRLWSTMVDFQNWPFWISRCKLSNEGNPDSSLMDNNFHL